MGLLLSVLQAFLSFVLLVGHMAVKEYRIWPMSTAQFSNHESYFTHARCSRNLLADHYLQGTITFGKHVTIGTRV